jgi:uncharacterized protein YkwD
MSICLLGMVALAVAGFWAATQSPPQLAEADPLPSPSKLPQVTSVNPVPSPSKTSPEAPSPTPAPVIPPQAQRKPLPTPGLVLSPEEQALVDMTNEARRKEKLPLLKPNPVLFRVARAHSVNMARQEVLDHELDGKKPHERVLAAGYSASWSGENIAYASGQVSLEQTFQGWMDSPGHRRNLLNKRFQEIGIGVARAANGDMYYTQVFGARE